ncbi:MAG: RHS repeat-associated core domain-containing protein [Kangiellaceae bacterium]|jgi:hypothetical protein|nr:RHS repeat-associated core domain-containing protein [Kangiellaceae bacterium]
MQARYYDPVIDRFYANDPVDAISHLSNVEGMQGFNRYSYAINNPYKYTDPDGRDIYFAGWSPSTGGGRASASVGFAVNFRDDGFDVAFYGSVEGGGAQVGFSPILDTSVASFEFGNLMTDNIAALSGTYNASGTTVGGQSADVITTKVDGKLVNGTRVTVGQPGLTNNVHSQMGYGAAKSVSIDYPELNMNINPGDYDQAVQQFYEDNDPGGDW